MQATNAVKEELLNLRCRYNFPDYLLDHIEEQCLKNVGTYTFFNLSNKNDPFQGKHTINQ